MEAGKCQFCEKTYKNVLLHIVKTHKKFLCAGCKEYKPKETAVYNIADKYVGKFCKYALCEECWT